MRDYRGRIKEALVIMGIIKNSLVRPPLLPIPVSDKEKIKQGLIDAKLI
jgi:dihydrodipicolinate synthase/N-acetylneuraminate lyase